MNSLKLKIITLLFVSISFVNPGCKYQSSALTNNEIEIYNLVFNKLQLSLYPEQYPPLKELKRMDKNQIENYRNEKYNSMRKISHHVYVYFTNESKYYIQSDTFSIKYKQLVEDDSAIRNRDSITIFNCLKPFSNHCLFIADEKFKFDYKSMTDKKKRTSIIFLSKLLMNNKIALIEGGYCIGPMAGEGTLFFLEKIKGMWVIVHEEQTWIS